MLRLTGLLALINLLSGLAGLGVAWSGDPLTDAPPAFVYMAGRGLDIGQTGLTLGGYANLEAEKPENQRASFKAEELSLLVNWHFAPRWLFYAETELEDVVTLDERGRTKSSDEDLVLQKRLYADYTWSEGLNVCAGKFLTPVGIWNPIHAAPLVWTVSRPHASDRRFFDDTATGVMLYGHRQVRGIRLDYSAYGQPTDQLLPQPDDHASSRRGVGTRLQVSDGGSWTFGLSSLAQDNQVQQRWEYVAGADFRWERGGTELWSEFITNTPAHGAGGSEWAFYLQAAVPIVWRFHLVGRYEHVDESTNMGLAGLAYRPWPSFVVKTQYVFADRSSPTVERGFAAALAILF